MAFAFRSARPLALLRRLPTLAAVLILAGSACSKEPVSPGGNGAADVSGVVADEKTGTGIQDVLVALVRDGHVAAVTQTDATGRFGFTGIAAGTYTAWVTGLELAGIDPRTTALEPEQQDVVVDGQPVSDVVFAGIGLIPARIVGDVTCGGQPAAGAQVRVVGGEADTTVVAGGTGRYGVNNLAAGHYAVLAVSVPCTPPSPWAAVEVKAGQEVQVDFTGP